MCGIAGILDYLKPISSHEIDLLTDSLAHRGPDGRGIYLDNSGNIHVALGHRRLAILDLSSQGQNPMPYGGEDAQRYWITYNGEVYNFLEIRKELQSLGHRFRSETDTEVLVAAYAQWGMACLERFNGMWAFAIWDTVEQSLILVRDRFGVKPLHYACYGSRFVFASELKAFLKLDSFEPALAEEIVPRVLQNSRACEGVLDQTLLHGVKRLMPGHYLKVSANGQVQISRWWDTRDHIPSDIPKAFEDQAATFRALFLDAVRIRMRSDVPLGTCLSGGVDSGAVASAMSWLHHQGTETTLERCSGDWQKTFIATFPDTFLDERDYADEVVRWTGAAPHYWQFDQSRSLDVLMDSVWSMEDVVSVIATPIWCTYRTMRQNNVFVSLDGHGGDELLGGYTWYLDCPIKDLNTLLFQDFHATLLPSILQSYDRCSMAHGIEVRMPIMDWRLVTYSFGLQPESKIGQGYTKSVFREAMRGIMPERIRRRRSKIGFNSPMYDWYNGAMSSFLLSMVQHPLFLGSPFWDGARLKDFIEGKTLSKSWSFDDWGMTLNIWTMINLVLWQIMFIERTSFSQINLMFLTP
jgi:asparagine synthase (glutamine-hydrolysing)